VAQSTLGSILLASTDPEAGNFVQIIQLNDDARASMESK
jgi:hypothetical protein